VSGGFLYDRKLADYLRKAGDDLHLIPFPWRNHLQHLLYNLSANTIRRVKELKLDLLLEDELNYASLIIINRALKSIKHCPILSIVHHLCKYESNGTGYKFRHRVEKTYLHGIDGFIFNSRTTAASVNEIAPDKPAVIAYPGKDRFVSEITEQEIAARAKNDGPLHVMFLGNIIPRKGLTALIRSLKPLPRATWRLTVIGSMDRNCAYTRSVLKR